MRLARNPGTEFADGDDHRGYSLVAPLTPDGKLDEAAFRQARKAPAPCAASRPTRTRRRASWCTAAGAGSSTTATRATPKSRSTGWASTASRVGEYVTITDEDGRLLTYKVTEVQRA